MKVTALILYYYYKKKKCSYVCSKIAMTDTFRYIFSSSDSVLFITVESGTFQQDT